MMVTTITMVMMIMLMRMTTDPRNDRKSSGESLRAVPVTVGTTKFRHDGDDDENGDGGDGVSDMDDDDGNSEG